MAGHIPPNFSAPNGSFKAPHVARWHTLASKGLGAMMWFWIMYRAKQDLPVVLGWRHPWDNHHGSHDH